MDHQYPLVNVAVGRNLGPSGMRRSNVVMRVETLVDDYFKAPDGQTILTGSFQFAPPQVFNFDLDCNITSYQIFDILRYQHQLNLELSLLLASKITREATLMGLGTNVFILNLLITVTFASVFDFGFAAVIGGEGSEGEEEEEEEEEEKEEVVKNLVLESVIDKDLELETESCPMSLDNQMGV